MKTKGRELVAKELLRHRDAARELNRAGRIYFHTDDGRLTAEDGPAAKQLYYPRVGLYHGQGSSHSWTWFVSLLDALDLCRVEFIDEADFIPERILNLDVLLMPGGDTFGIAGGLGEAGGRLLESFVKQGGLYIGSCAGAYLPLHSSKDPLFHFNFVPVKIKNLAKFLPEPKRMASKFSTPYGCSFIYHPVREELRLRSTGNPPFYLKGEVIAPLYGGPSLIPSEEAIPLAYYQGFTDKTLLLVDEELALATLQNHWAAIRRDYGAGSFFLFAPHFEHPHYPKANALVANSIWYGIKPKDKNAVAVEGKNARVSLSPSLFQDLKRNLSNARIQAFALERENISWLIGHKYYEPIKIGSFLNLIWERLPRVKAAGFLPGAYSLFPVMEQSQAALRDLKEIRVRLTDGTDSTPAATRLFATLKQMTADFLRPYFALRRELLGSE